MGVRRRVYDAKAPPPGKAISGCTRWRYQALVTSLKGSPESLWRFYNHRTHCERVFKVARGALGMGWLVGHKLRANEVAFLLRLLAFNADQRFQMFAEQPGWQAGQQAIRRRLVARQRRFYRSAGRLLRTKRTVASSRPSQRRDGVPLGTLRTRLLRSG